MFPVKVKGVLSLDSNFLLAKREDYQNENKVFFESHYSQHSKSSIISVLNTIWFQDSYEEFYPSNSFLYHSKKMY